MLLIYEGILTVPQNDDRINNMNKSLAIELANDALRAQVLTPTNTQFSQVVRYGDLEGWWLNIPLTHFRQANHFLLCSEKARIVRHLLIKPNAILSPATKFRIKDGIADVFISAANPKRLADTLSGGTKYSFNKHLVDEYRY